MRRLTLILTMCLLATRVFASPSNSIAVPNLFSPNTTIESSKVNANENEVQSKFNAHDHTDITQTGTVTSGTWNGTVIDETYGGTGSNFSSASPGGILAFNATGNTSIITHATVGSILYSNGASIPLWLPNSTSGFFLKNNGFNQAPSWASGGLLPINFTLPCDEIPI